MAFDTIYGVDFSAHEGDAAYKTWVAEATHEGDTLRVSSVRCAWDAFDLSAAGRAGTLPALVSFLGDESNALVGLDFPFSLPAAVVEDRFDATTWPAFLAEFTEVWSSPRALFDDVNDTEGTVRRDTDDEHGGQPPAGWRIKTQTYYGNSAVLAPLVRDHDASAPSFRSEGSGPTLLETYPAGVFDEAGLNRDGYKGVPEDCRERRRANVDGLRSEGVELPEDVASLAAHNDDALDSLACAYAAWRHADEDLHAHGDSIEGRIYV